MLDAIRLHDYKVELPSYEEVKSSLEFHLFVAAAVLIVLFTIWAGVHAVVGHFAPSPSTAIVTVRPGDTIWTFAQNYGNPDTYILKRVQRIAELNRIDASKPLAVGNKLIVPMEQPTRSASARTATP